jgi:hypothetical protein
MECMEEWEVEWVVDKENRKNNNNQMIHLPNLEEEE